jgi:biopolymer transport protein TolR
MPGMFRNEAQKINSRINVTPMVDVMLVLLIIFMVIAPMLGPDKSLQMARTSNPIDMPDANKADALVVSVMRDGKIFLGDESVAAPDLTQRITARLNNQPNQIVYVRADARARYGLLVNAVDEVRAAGIDQLGLLTEKKEPARGTF